MFLIAHEEDRKLSCVEIHLFHEPEFSKTGNFRDLLHPKNISIERNRLLGILDPVHRVLEVIVSSFWRGVSNKLEDLKTAQ